MKDIILRTCQLKKKNLFIDQNVKMLFRKLVQKTYQLHKNSAKNVHM